MYVSNSGIQMLTEGMLSIRGARGFRSYLTFWSTSRRICMPAAKLLGKAINHKGWRYLILVSLTNRSHQVNSRSLFVPCLAVVVYDETWWPILSVHISYKPISSWRILFWYGGLPRHFSRLKNFRSMVLPGGVWRKEVIIQGIQIKRRVSCGRPVIPDKKRGCNGSVWPCTQK